MRRVITLLAVTATALLVGMGSAQAHSELISSSPAADSVLDFGPPGVELVFNQNIQNQFVNVSVTAPDGTQVGQGEPSVQGAKVLLPILDGVGSGQYTVGYRVISEDGHPITGTYSFTLALPAPPVSQAAAASAAPAPAAADSEQSGSGSSLVLPILGGVVALLFVTGIVIVLRGERRKKD
ncbi:copper resistance protein CopC [Rhodococcus sp. IEGM 1351]|uniref:copper resistance CopC family protein n=1 Tax=Rhodococcus sp. IEGM 1351 TaxID=3047089 RepID=UPI0024B63BFD|nr:copper resistance CopC family protein [Rhodococcus sp. IEGM 1351]MDI9938904.1 copper resistance protein CopC [Rhodococcus sp. IEGM 1351]